MGCHKLLVVNVVGLTPGVLSAMPALSKLTNSWQLLHLKPALPAVTCTSQATITTGTLPRQHGIVSNGWYFRDSAETRFWLRSDRLVQGEKIWDVAKSNGLKTANLFWRFCTHSSCDIVVTERPTYWANGKKSPDVFCWPGSLHERLVDQLGPFPLFRFWGPATNIESTQWIADATEKLIEEQQTDLTLTYLPHLDYDLQKYGPSSPQASGAIEELDRVVTQLVSRAKEAGLRVVLLSEYGMADVDKPVYLNRILRENGYLEVQNAQNVELLECGQSRAFAACSHQVAHVYVHQPQDISAVKKLISSVDGVAEVLDADGIKQQRLDHPRSGELVVVAQPGCWFAYPYWLDESRAPDFAHCVAIHDKPGHDPAEMFLGPGGKARVAKRVLQNKMRIRVPFDVISTDATKIRGSHGRLPEGSQDGPILLSDTAINGIQDDALSMHEVKSKLLDLLVRA